MKRKTKAIIVIIGILFTFGGIFGYFKFTEQMEKPVPEKEKAIVEHAGVTLENKIVTKEELLYPDNLIEHKVNEAIHSMSHQKVEAKVKWGHTQITQAKVERLLDVAKMNDYKYKELYVSILERWSKGDFSHAVEDHNAIWEIQGGDESRNSGKAIRLLSPEEEQAYIEHNLASDLYDK
ncbi:DUF6241 domain-containing protein [Lysinibacillus pakistanensis]|uniref:DUF6241 domain-containing protein n=1 Tax=Lysinibacillus pakistanensis TaxID=759811 RepID=A0AAX3WUH6_9BACI|nr:DUF6241 domain-containing protein [Lysinibacillus pakistanensis]MDM5229762.1 DUF6241 domain-containing protein [Lysinibacillus pakistanensis]WHY45366.1 DUF6241 domain-containing protein [Lysinibacillus pakistanensis]WHY50374.1 DUF6241 domain-containing protein [Lysinibacillus pakistanensis]